jgi:hypothetical protein
MAARDANVVDARLERVVRVRVVHAHQAKVSFRRLPFRVRAPFGVRARLFSVVVAQTQNTGTEAQAGRVNARRHGLRATLVAHP